MTNLTAVVFDVVQTAALKEEKVNSLGVCWLREHVLFCWNES